MIMSSYSLNVLCAIELTINTILNWTSFIVVWCFSILRVEMVETECFRPIIWDHLVTNDQFWSLIKNMHNKQYGEYFERLVYLTETRWPNEYDQNWWIWPKNAHRQTLTFKLDRNFTTTTNNNVWIWPKIYI